MARPPKEDDRLAAVESRLAFLDDAVDRLSDVVARQDRELVELGRQVRAMADRLRDLGEFVSAEAMGTGHEPPPHY
jgi:SlyX protein